MGEPLDATIVAENSIFHQFQPKTEQSVGNVAGEGNPDEGFLEDHIVKRKLLLNPTGLLSKIIVIPNINSPEATDVRTKRCRYSN